MSSYLTTSAVILAEEPFREQDLRLEVYSPNTGLASAVLKSGRSINSKLRPHAIVFDRTVLTLARQGNVSYLSQAALIERLTIDANIVVRYRAAAAAAALVRMARPDLTDIPHLFFLLDNFFRVLNSRKQGFLAPLLTFLLGVLAVSGVMPQFNRCGACRSSTLGSTAVFSLAEGVAFHQHCRHPTNTEKLNSNLALDLQSAMAGRLPTRPGETFSFLLNFAKYHLEAR